MKFTYRRYEVGAGNGTAPRIIYRPVATVRLIGPTGNLQLCALLDTGADQTLFPRWAADQIGIDVDDTDPLFVVGIGGQRIPAPSGEIVVEISDTTQTLRWATVARFVTLPDSQSQLAILGHEGCLNYLTAVFDGLDRSVDLMPNSAFPRT